MRKLSLTEWAALSEIIGTAAIVFSLVFVTFSINQNTAVMQASSENVLYELQFARVRDIVSNPGVASIYVKRNRNEKLSEEEQLRFHWDKIQELETWNIAFSRHRDGLFSTERWEAWNDYFVVEFTDQFPAESWAEVRNWYPEDFQRHVDAVYAIK